MLDEVVQRFGGVTAVDGVSLEVGPRERLAIIGPNGAGKTTVFRLIAGEFRPTEGRIFLFGHDVTGLSVHRRARMGLSRTFQVSNLFLSLSTVDNVRVALQARSPVRWRFWKRIRSGDAIEEEARHMLERVGLAGANPLPETPPHRAARLERSP
ncbi:MAG TPA: ATP-binding cassette domain-containing protein, partial [Acidimicrobiia bacterium]|nr:ATP-binding cassette domain-containing protein [Acidimicrobiia bacterium]